MRLTGIGTFIAVLLAGLIPTVVVAGAQGQAPSAKSFALRHSVVVIGPNSPLFETVLAKDFPGVSQVNCFQAVEPLLAILHNNTRRIIKGYMVKWTVTNADGSKDTASLVGLNEPDSLWKLTGQRTVMGLAGTGLGTLLVSPFFRWSKKRFPVLLSSNAVVGAFCAIAEQTPVEQEPLVAKARDAVNVQAKIDGIIFGDGVFVGPDTSRLYEKFEVEQKAQVDEGTWMLNQLNNGATDEELRNTLSDQIYNGRNSTGTDQSSLYTAARGREAGRLLGGLSQLNPTALRETVVWLARQKPLALRKKGTP